jgi:hypothetical protein
VKETTGLQWQRDQQVMDLDPDLVVIHLSCFYEETNTADSDKRFRSFLAYMEKSRAKFLVYSRGPHGKSAAEKEQRWQEHLAFLYETLPQERLQLFIVPGGERASFRDRTTGQALKQRVKLILGIP